MVGRSRRSARRALWGVTGAVAAALTFAPTVAAAGAIIQVEPLFTTITLSPEEVTTARVPYTLLADSDAGLALTVQTVARDGVPVTLADDAVSVGADTDLDALDITIQNDQLDRVGTYAMSLRVTADESESAQLLTLSITRPDAALILPTEDPIEIDRTVWFPELSELSRPSWVTESMCCSWLGWLTSEDGEQTDPPVVVEIGPTSRVSELLARPRTADEVFVVVTAPGTDGGGAAVFTDLLADGPVDPGALIELAESVRGDPPLGTVQRSVRLTSPQLSKPVDIPYSITTRRSYLLIPITIVIGLLFGLLGRTLPKWFYEKAATEDRVRSLTLQLQGLKKHPDQRVQDLAVEQLAALDKSGSLKMAQRNELVDQSIAAMNRELERVDVAVAEQRERLEALERVVRRRWSVPAATAALIDQMGQRVDAGFTLADSGDARNVQLAADDIDNMLASPLDAAIKVDADELGQAAGGIARAIEGKGPLLFDGLATRAAMLRDDAGRPPEEAQTAVHRLEWLHNLSGRGNELAKAIAEAFQGLTVEDGAASAQAERQSRIVAQLKLGAAGSGLVAARPDIESFAQNIAARPEMPEFNERTLAADGPQPTAESPVPSAQLQSWARRAPRHRWVAAESSARVWRRLGFVVGAARYAVLLTLLLIVSYGWLATDWTGSLADISTGRRG